MTIPFSRAPHIEGAGAALHSQHAPNAALLIDFDNVTMGMRSDLSRELKNLLESDIIKGKVTVQRAYADWRRYPQYIVPLSEASIDLIFAPAYGSNKKNATDIRMAIDGIELVFTRPEIGTFILLTGDSDFSSLVLKLKEYGKYVIGVGIQESSSDILVQNCDEYYSYTSISGLRKSDEGGSGATDPWALVEKAVEQMVKRRDVMRSDRLKQVMLEMDPSFDEKGLGFKQFSKFLAQASSKGLVETRKMENGQYEISRSSGGAGRSEDRGGGRRPDRGRSGRSRDQSSGRGRDQREAPRAETPAGGGQGDAASEPAEIGPAYDLLRKAVRALMEEQESDSVRDSDVKRRMLLFDPAFDEGALGFPKFSRFLGKAHDQEIVTLRKGEAGNYQVALVDGTAPQEPRADVPKPSGGRESAPKAEPVGTAVPVPETASPAAGTSGADPTKLGGSLWSRLFGKPGGTAEPPPLFEGQGVPSRKESGDAPSRASGRVASAAGPPLDPASLRLPTGPESMVQYLTNSYAGVGEKTAETLVSALGEELFVVLQTDPARVEALLPPTRAEKVLEGWAADLERRRTRHGGDPISGGGAASGATVGSGASEEGTPFAPRARRTRGEL